MTVKVTLIGSELKIETPYNAVFVAELKGIAGRRWDAASKAWFVPASQAEQVGALVRKFFPVPGAAVEYEKVVIDVVASSSRKRTYCGNVTVDGVEVVSRAYGSPVAKSGAFETIKVEGPGFVSGDPRRAFEVQYRLTLKVRKGAVIDSYSHAAQRGSVEIISREPWQ